MEKIFRLLDMASVWGAGLLLFALLRRWVDFEGALTGILILALLLPLSMFLHYFQPWDKPSLLLWVAMVLALVSSRYWLFLALYALSIANKFDAILAAGLPLFVNFGKYPIRRVVTQTAAAIVVGGMSAAVLMLLFPGGQESRDIFGYLSGNLHDALYLNVAHPPLLVYGTLTLLAAFAWREGDTEQRRLWLFGLALLIPHALFTNFQEVRAQFGALVCMIPLAVQGLRTGLGRGPQRTP
jgi:hypothetical protein